MTKVEYPEVVVQLTGNDGNAFAIMSAVRKAMRHHDVPDFRIEQCIDQMMSGDYDNLLQVALRWVTVL